MARHLTIGGGRELSQQQLRAGVQGHVNAEDIRSVDRQLLEWVQHNRAQSHLIIDTHQVTLESHGLSFTPFDDDLLAELRVDEFWLLAVPVATIVERIVRMPAGRLRPSAFMADLHAQVQASVCTGYAMATGRPMFVLDGSSGPSALDFAQVRLAS